MWLRCISPQPLASPESCPIQKGCLLRRAIQVG
eukprot:CAMPEP_0118949182 /NCGR_PEP_ID=MMETSP1169-20130426/49190_1 /TAXON_ID=36882 /ORGANISM="Pyramimonas obovata, Strain CCMP722" /LENGTH=32 /DNA_ID= /DNA_START= /DNA_END= /DNA_ORIENTATION=